MNREKIKKIKDKNLIVSVGFDILRSSYAWFLNYIVSIIPIWSVRKFFYLISGMKIGKDARIGIFTKVVRPNRISIGNRSVVNEYCYLDGRGGLNIGSDTSISIYTKFITATHRMNSENFDYVENGTIVGDRVWIGCNAIILDKSVVKNGCVIGAGSVFKGKTNENEVYVGNPAKVIKSRTVKEYHLNFHPFFR